MSIFARSPYIETIAETGQVGSKLLIYIWNGSGSAPSDPQYTLSKLIPSSNNINTYYNISPYIREYISWNIRQTPYNTTSVSQSTQYCNVKVQRFKLTSGGTYSFVSETTYKAFDGFGYYEAGYNPSLSYDILHRQGTYNYAFDLSIDPSTNVDYRAGYILVRSGTSYKAKYTNLNTGVVVTNALTNNSLTDVLRVLPANYADGNNLSILDASNNVIWTAYFKPYLNCKYTPVLCDFVNEYGCWQRTWFYAASNDTLNVENTNYNTMQSTFPDYNVLEGQTKTFNSNGKNSIKVNTDWVSEEYKHLLKSLMLSERILINNLPAKMNTKNTELYKSINTKMINYQLEFEFAFNTINNVI